MVEDKAYNKRIKRYEREYLRQRRKALIEKWLPLLREQIELSEKRALAKSTSTKGKRMIRIKDFF